MSDEGTFPYSMHALCAPAMFRRDAGVQRDAWDTVLWAVCHALEILKPSMQIVVDLLDDVVVGDDDAGYGFAAYNPKFKHISIACTPPEEMQDDRAWFLHQLALSTMHEVVHFQQHMEGRLEGSEENEAEADRVASKLMRRWSCVPRPHNKYGTPSLYLVGVPDCLYRD